MITGKNSPCQYGYGSQLDAAVDYLKAHPGTIDLITLDIGANDLVAHCLKRTGLIPRACALDLRPKLKARVRQIVQTLQVAADPGVPVVAMNYYNPFLGFWALVPGGHRLARTDLRAWRVFNASLVSVYESEGVKVADVARTFRIDDFHPTRFVHGIGRVPVNVARACKWTWFCSHRFTGDVHPNRTGHSRIARAFERALSETTP